MKYKHGHHHHRRRHRKYVHRGPLVSSKQYVRITCRQPLAIRISDGQGELTRSTSIQWQQPAGSVTNTLGFNFAESQWHKEYRNWEEYAITGLRIDYVPAANTASQIGVSASGGPVNRLITGIWTFDDPNSYDPANITLADALNRKDARTHNPRAKWHMYKDARPYSAS
jgi:hypothetical protein